MSVARRGEKEGGGGGNVNSAGLFSQDEDFWWDLHIRPNLFNRLMANYKGRIARAQHNRFVAILNPDKITSSVYRRTDILDAQISLRKSPDV